MISKPLSYFSHVSVQPGRRSKGRSGVQSCIGMNQYNLISVHSAYIVQLLMNSTLDWPHVCFSTTVFPSWCSDNMHSVQWQTKEVQPLTHSWQQLARKGPKKMFKKKHTQKNKLFWGSHYNECTLFPQSGGWWSHVPVVMIMMISLDRTSVWAATYSFISRLGICKFKTSYSDERFPPRWPRLYLPAANTEMHIHWRKTLDHGRPGSVQTRPKILKLFISLFFFLTVVNRSSTSSFHLT